jgi:hypothetical protein
MILMILLIRIVNKQIEYKILRGKGPIQICVFPSGFSTLSFGFWVPTRHRNDGKIQTEALPNWFERLANKRPAFMCHPCDMDAPAQHGTRGEGFNFVGIWKHGT